MSHWEEEDSWFSDGCAFDDNHSGCDLGGCGCYCHFPDRTDGGE